MHALRREGYVLTESAPSGVIVRITKSKKFPQPGRSSAHRLRRFAERATQSRVEKEAQRAWNQHDASGIGSSSVARSKEKENLARRHEDLHNPSRDTDPENQNLKSAWLEQLQNQGKNSRPDSTSAPRAQHQNRFFLEARLRQQLLRAERDEAGRRELAVGGGPEVPRS